MPGNQFQSLSAKLTTRQVQEMYNRLRTGEISQGQAAREYGIGVTQVGRIFRGESRATETGANLDVRLNRSVQISQEEVEASWKRLQERLAAGGAGPNLYSDPPPTEEHQSNVLDRLTTDIAQHPTTQTSEALGELLTVDDPTQKGDQK